MNMSFAPTTSPAPARTLQRRRRRLQRRPPCRRLHLRAVARPARDRGHRPCRRSHARRIASPVPSLGRPHPQGVPPGIDARPCAPPAARIRERARCRLRGRPVGSGAAARPLRHPRSDVAGPMEGRRRGPHPRLRLPSLPVRHRPRDRDRARPGRPRLRRRRRGIQGARRHARPLAAGGIPRGHRRHGGAGAPHLRAEAVAARPAAAGRHDRHRFRGAGVGDAA